MMDVSVLAELPRETAEHDGDYERIAPPRDWWDSYAAYMSAREDGVTEEAASAAAAHYMEVRHVLPR